MWKEGPWVILAAVLLAASLPVHSGGEPPRQGIAPPARIPDVVTDPGPAGEPVTTASIPREVRRAVVADAARRFKVVESDVVLTRAEQITWNDGSLGCPQPGQMYTQMLVPGYRVVAQTREGNLQYHTDSRGHAVACGTNSSEPATRLRDKVVKPVEPRTQPPGGSPPDR